MGENVDPRGPGGLQVGIGGNVYGNINGWMDNGTRALVIRVIGIAKDRSTWIDSFGWVNVGWLGQAG